MADPFQNIAAYTRLESVLEAIPDAALLLDLDKSVIAANAAFRQTFSDGKNVQGRYCHEVCHCLESPCDPLREKCPFEECLVRSESVQALHVHRTAQGGRLTALTMRPLMGPNGKIDSLLETLHPIEIASATPTAERRLHGQSIAFRWMLQTIRRIAPTRNPVLIVGESGTDKELVAHAIHDLSQAQGKQFVPVDCAALQDWQFVGEIFEHRSAAGSGSGRANASLVAAAEGGTLFLKEIDTLNLAAQARLLRLLETGYCLLDDKTKIARADFRLICSSSIDLMDAVQKGEFRNDLRLRIASFPIQAPPLRCRIDDIPILVESALRRLSCLTSCGGVHPDALARLQAYSFPGNLRELRSIVEQACLNAQGGPILLEHLPAEVVDGGARSESTGGLQFEGEVLPLSTAERMYVRWARRRLSCSQAELAHRLEISERSLYRKLSEPSGPKLENE